MGLCTEYTHTHTHKQSTKTHTSECSITREHRRDLGTNVFQGGETSGLQDADFCRQEEKQEAHSCPGILEMKEQPSGTAAGQLHTDVRLLISEQEDLANGLCLAVCFEMGPNSVPQAA